MTLYFTRKHRENHEKLPRKHLIGYQGVKKFLLKDHFKVSFVLHEICHNLSFVTIWVCQAVTIWAFEFCHNLSFWVWSQFEFFFNFGFGHNLGFVTIGVLSQFEFCNNLRFKEKVLSQFIFFSLVTNWVFGFCHHLSFWFFSPFQFLSFVIICVFELITICVF